MAISLFAAKKAVMYPWTLYMRHVKERDMQEPTRTIFDSNYYRRPLYDFLSATIQNPDILVDAELDNTSLVLDVGAYVGAWTSKIVDRYGCAVHAFEPAPTSLAHARKLLDGREGVQLHAFGLGSSDLRATLAMAGPGSSIHTEHSPMDSYVEVEIRDVAAVLDELGIGDVDLLKVNIEGAEFDLFDRLIETGWLPRFRQVMVQFHEFHPGVYRRRATIRRALRRTHEPIWDYPWVWELWRRIET